MPKFLRVKAGYPNVCYVNVDHIEAVWVHLVPSDEADSESGGRFGVFCRLRATTEAMGHEYTVRDGFVELPHAQQYLQKVLHV